jgi:tetratricopeptide (TPR) repeat protein/VanZ family protein
MSVHRDHTGEPSAFRNVCNAIFGDKWFSSRMKLGVVCCAVVCLTYVLCVSDPWSIFGFLSHETKRSFSASDKVLHGFSYFVLSTIFMWYAATKSRAVVITFIALAMAHGVATEVAQRFVPDRTFDLADIAADFFGVFMGVVLGLTLRRFVATDEAVPVGTQRIFNSPTPGPGTNDTDLPASKDSMGLARETLNSEEIQEIQPRMLNLRFIGIFCAAACVVLSSVYAIHGWQVQRNANKMLDLGRKAQAKGNIKQAKNYFNRYVGMVPNDVNALADFGTLLDDTRPENDDAHRVFMVFENVLRSEPTRDDIRRRQIKIAMEIGRTNDALAHATTLTQANPKDGGLHFLVGQCHEELDDFDQAAEAYKRAISHDPQMVEAFSHLALIEYKEFEHPERATELFDQLIEFNPKNVDAWLARSLFRKDTEQFDDAHKDMQEALKLAQDDARVILAAAELGYAQAAASRKAGRKTQVERIVARTRELLKRGIQTHNEHLGLQLQSVLLESHFGNQADALKQVDAILTESPVDARAQLLLADLTIERGDFERAEEALQQLPRTPTSDALRLFLQGRIAMAEKRLEDAVSHFEKARRFMGESVSMLERTDLALAQCHAAQKDSEAQLTDYRRILKYRPNSVPARIGLAASFLRHNQLAQAIAEYRQLSQLPQVRLLLVRLLIIQNMQLPEVARDWNDVETLLDEAKAGGDPPTQVVLLRAEVMALRGQLDDARHLIETARTTQTDRVEFLMALGQLAEKSGEKSQSALWIGQAMAAVGNVQDAEASLLKALEADPTNATAGQSLMRLYLNQDKRREAIVVFQKVARSMSSRQLARSYAVFGDFQRAIQLYEQELQAKPESFEVLDQLSELFLRNGHAQRAQPLLERILELEGLIPESQLQAARRKLAVAIAGQGSFIQFKQGLELLGKNKLPDGTHLVADQRALAAVLATSRDQEDWRQALSILETLEDQQQLVPSDRWLLGRLYDQLGQSEQATVQLEQAIKAGAGGAMFVRQYVAHLIRLKKFQRATHWLNQLQQQEPDTIGTLTLNVYLNSAQGNADAAVALLTEYLSTNDSATNESKAQRLAVAADIATAAMDETKSAVLSSFAEKALKQAAQLDKSRLSRLVTWYIQQDQTDAALLLIEDLWQHASPDLAGGLSMLLLGETRNDDYFDLIESHVQRTLKKSPKSLPLKLFLADLLSLKNEIASAEELYREILHVDGNHLGALNNLAWLLAIDERHQDEALALIERAIKRVGPLPQLLDTRGCVYTSLGNTREAVADLKKAISQEPRPTTWLHLSAAHQLAGDNQLSQKALDKANRLGLANGRLHPLDIRIMEKLIVTGKN